MTNRNYLPSMLSIVFAIACLGVSALGQSGDFASVSSTGSGVRWDIKATHASVTLSVIGPDDVSYTKEFKSGVSPEFSLINSKGERLLDGQYTYELRLTPSFSSEVRESLKSAREKGNEADVKRDLRRRGQLSNPVVQSGGFSVLNGMVVTPGVLETPGRAAVQPQSIPSTPATPAVATSSGRANVKIRRNHAAFVNFFDFVIADDLIVQGSICAGLDCVDGENFGFDTIRVKENNTRIQFDDTSTSAGFPNNNWQIRANDSGSGGANFLAFVDQGATGNSETGTIVFAVTAGASANSLRVGSNSKIGLRTATPVLDIHASTTDTPAMRLEQNNS